MRAQEQGARTSESVCACVGACTRMCAGERACARECAHTPLGMCVTIYMRMTKGSFFSTERCSSPLVMTEVKH